MLACRRDFLRNSIQIRRSRRLKGSDQHGDAGNLQESLVSFRETSLTIDTDFRQGKQTVNQSFARQNRTVYPQEYVNSPNADLMKSDIRRKQSFNRLNRSIRRRKSIMKRGNLRNSGIRQQNSSNRVSRSFTVHGQGISFSRNSIRKSRKPNGFERQHVSRNSSISRCNSRISRKGRRRKITSRRNSCINRQNSMVSRQFTIRDRRNSMIMRRSSIRGPRNTNFSRQFSIRNRRSSIANKRNGSISRRNSSIERENSNLSRMRTNTNDAKFEPQRRIVSLPKRSKRISFNKSINDNGRVMFFLFT